MLKLDLRKTLKHALICFIYVSHVSMFLDLRRQNAFQVIAVDGVCSGIIQCPSAEECTEWLQAIASNISALTKHNVRFSAVFHHEILIKFKVSCSGRASMQRIRERVSRRFYVVKD